MKTKTLIFLLLTTLYNVNIHAQVGDDLSKFINMGGKIVSSPFNFDSNDILNLSLVTAATFGSFFLDNTGRQWALHNNSNFKDDLFSIDNSTTVFVGAAVMGTYGYGLINKNNKIRTIGLQLAEATFYAGGINFLFKSLIGRTRPLVNDGHKNFDPFKFSFNQTSLPSGHSTLAFAFSTVMADKIDNIFWMVGWYGAASVVGISRVYNDKHWVSDVVLGGAIGYFVGRFVLNNQEDDKELMSETKQNKTSYSLGLKYFNNQPIYSLNFGYSF